MNLVIKTTTKKEKQPSKIEIEIETERRIVYCYDNLSLPMLMKMTISTDNTIRIFDNTFKCTHTYICTRTRTYVNV